MEVSQLYFRYDENEQEKVDSIPFQLQKLFAHMQLGNKAASTASLMKSF